MRQAPTTTPITQTFGVEAQGIDLSKPLDPETAAWVDDAINRHAIVVFRNQSLDARQLAAFGRLFGAPRPHSLERYRHPDTPEVSFLTNLDEEGKPDKFGAKRATAWHTDETYDEHLPRLAILHALEVTSQRGGTIFADMRTAYDTLSPALRERLETLTARHGYTTGPDGERLYGGELARKFAKTHPERQRPAISVHPRTGRRVLFVNPLHTHGFVGLEQDEAHALIETLSAHATRPDNIYYHSWRVGDVLMWDETSTMHRGAGDYNPEERRVMLRTIVH
jgi:taurine dioxygenase